MRPYSPSALPTACWGSVSCGSLFLPVPCSRQSAQVHAHAHAHTCTHQFTRTYMYTRAHKRSCALLLSTRIALPHDSYSLALPSGAAPLVPTMLPLWFPVAHASPSASPSLPRTPLPSLLFTPSLHAPAPAQLPFFATGALLLGSAIMAWSIPSALWQASPEAKPPAAGAPPVTPLPPGVAPPPSAPQPTDSDR